MKKIFSILYSLLFITHNAHATFEPDLCQHGYAGSWTGACICQNKNFADTYCNEKSDIECKTNQNCPKNTYCHITNKLSGFCFKNTTHRLVKSNKKTFVLSNALMDKKSTDNFCHSLLMRPAQRKDFGCTSIGVSCLDLKTFIPLKKEIGTRGFFWLEYTNSNDKVYYADFNDATIYQTNAHNKSTMQALCIKE